MNYPNYYAPAAPQVPMYNPAMYNPAFGAAQARLTQMEQQYPQFAQQQPAPPATQTQDDKIDCICKKLGIEVNNEKHSV